MDYRSLKHAVSLVCFGMMLGLIGSMAVSAAEYTIASPWDMGLPFQKNAAASSIASIIKETIKYVGILAVISLTWGGIQFLISWGDDQKIKNGKKIIIYSLVGVILAVSAYTIVDVVKDLKLG